MPDPIVTKVVDKDGVERWGATDVAWVQDGLAAGSLTDPAVEKKSSKKAAAKSEEPTDAPTVPADSDSKDTGTGKH